MKGIRRIFDLDGYAGERLERSIPDLMNAADGGDRAASEALFVALYAELRRVARRELVRYGQPITLSATTLLHEAYLDMAKRHGLSFPDRGRFMSYAARVMRGLIVDHARARLAQKRGGKFELTSIGTDVREHQVDHRELARISEALDELGETEPALAEVVDLKFFCGLTTAEIAAAQRVSESTVERSWKKARIYLYQSLKTPLPR